MPLVFFVITSLFNCVMLPLLPYMKCLLLYGYNSLNNLCHSGDQSFSVNTQSCYDVHKLLERAGRAYASRLVKILSTSRAIGLVRGVIDLSVDGLHMPYDGKKRVEDWGTPFSTLMNKAYPGLYPLTAVDLASGLILYAGSFVRAGTNECRKHLGDVVAPHVMECIELLQKAGITVRSVIADEGITSHALMSRLISKGIEYVLALRANSILRRFEPWVKRWSKLDDDDGNRFMGIHRQERRLPQRDDKSRHDQGWRKEVPLHLQLLEGRQRRLEEVLQARQSRAEARRGVNDGNKEPALEQALSDQGARPRLHLHLNLILKALCREFNLGDIDVETLRSMFTRECYIKWDRETGKMHATIVASKSLLNKLGSRRITKWDRGTIEFIYYRETSAPKIPDNL
jgi:hypothetical protein